MLVPQAQTILILQGAKCGNTFVFYTPVDDCDFVFDFVSDKYKTQEIKCNKVVSGEPFVLKHCLNPEADV